MYKPSPFHRSLCVSLLVGVALSAGETTPETTLAEVKVRSQGSAQKPLEPYRAQRVQNGALGEQRPLETPFSLEVIPAAILENQQAQNLSDAFRGDASVTPIANNIVGEASGVAIRGLQLDLLNGYKIDGLSIPNWGSDLPLEHFEQVQLLKGLSGFLYGFGAPGGIANYMLKRPGTKDAASVDMGLSSEGVLKVHGDLGLRLGSKEQFGLRANAVHEAGDTYVEDGHLKRDSFSLAMDTRLGSDLLLSLDGLYQNRRVDGSYYGIIPAQAYGIPVAEPVRIPEALDGAQRVAQPFTYYETSYRIFGAELLWAANSAWDLRVSFRDSHQDRLNRDSAILLMDNQGTYSETQYNTFGQYDTQSFQALATGRLSTGSLSHEINVGAMQQTADQEYPRAWSSAFLGTGNIHQVGLFADPQLALDKSTYRYATTEQTALFASDKLSLGGPWSLLAGLRHTNYRQDTFAPDGSRSNRYDRQVVTPTLALLYHPETRMSFYGSYVESLEQGGTAPMTAQNANEVFSPIKSRQYETGFKFEGATLNLNAALFRIERGLEYLTSNNLYVQSGEAVHQGLDLNAKLSLGKGWTLLGSALLQDAKNRKSSAEVEGKRTAGSSRFQGSVYVEYALPKVEGLVLTGGLQHVGDRPLEASNLNIAEAFTTVQIGARYGFHLMGKDSTLRVGVDNLTNEKYWLTSWGFILHQGAPRTLRASLQVRF